MTDRCGVPDVGLEVAMLHVGQHHVGPVVPDDHAEQGQHVGVVKLPHHEGLLQERTQLLDGTDGSYAKHHTHIIYRDLYLGLIGVRV